MRECWSAAAQGIPEVVRASAGLEGASEPTPDQMLDQRTAEQHAIDRLLPAWRRIVEENLFVR